MLLYVLSTLKEVEKKCKRRVECKRSDKGRPTVKIRGVINNIGCLNFKCVSTKDIIGQFVLNKSLAEWPSAMIHVSTIKYRIVNI